MVRCAEHLLQGPNNGIKSVQVYPEHPRTFYVGAEADDWPTLRKYGGVRDKPEHSLPQFWVLEGGVQRNEPGNRTIGLYHSQLAIGV